MTLRIGVSPFGTTREGALRVAEVAAEGGVESFWFGDGLLAVDDFPQWSGGMESFTHLAWLAGRHPGMRLGVGAAVIPLRDPLWTVRQAATLAHLGGAGVVLGLCPGFWEREFAYRGLDYSARGRVFDEYIDVVHAALRGESFAGQWVTLPDDGRVSPVVSAGQVDVWLAGGRATFERALVRGLPFQASRRSPDELTPLAAEWHDRGGTTLAVRVRVTIDATDGSTPGTDVEWGTVAGSESEIADALHRYEEIGVSDISIVPGQDDETSLRTVTRLVEHVLPRLGDANVIPPEHDSATMRS